MIKPFQMKVIAKIHNDFSSKFGIPRQSGIVEDLKSTIIFEEDYRNPDAVRGLEGFSHIWIIWQFSEFISDKWSPTVRPPRLGGNKRMGVFATRSPFRPNSIGLSSVRLDKIEIDKKLGPVLHISGADIMNNSPIYDIKPYLAYTDSHPNATGGFSLQSKEGVINVNFPKNLLDLIPKDKQASLISILAQDPRPAYITDDNRIYGLEFADFNIRFTVENKLLNVHEVEHISV